MFLTLVGKKRVQLSESVLVGASSHASFATVILEKIKHIWIFLTTSIDVCSRVGKFSRWNDIRGCRETLVTGQTTVLCRSGLIQCTKPDKVEHVMLPFFLSKEIQNATNSSFGSTIFGEIVPIPSSWAPNPVVFIQDSEILMYEIL